jgi:hypothetical protein
VGSTAPTTFESRPVPISPVFEKLSENFKAFGAKRLRTY